MRADHILDGEDASLELQDGRPRLLLRWQEGSPPLLGGSFKVGCRFLPPSYHEHLRLEHEHEAGGPHRSEKGWELQAEGRGGARQGLQSEANREGMRQELVRVESGNLLLLVDDQGNLDPDLQTASRPLLLSLQDEGGGGEEDPEKGPEPKTGGNSFGNAFHPTVAASRPQNGGRVLLLERVRNGQVNA